MTELEDQILDLCGEPKSREEIHNNIDSPYEEVCRSVQTLLYTGKLQTTPDWDYVTADAEEPKKYRLMDPSGMYPLFFSFWPNPSQDDLRELHYAVFGNDGPVWLLQEDPTDPPYRTSMWDLWMEDQALGLTEVSFEESKWSERYFKPNHRMSKTIDDDAWFLIDELQSAVRRLLDPEQIVTPDERLSYEELREKARTYLIDHIEEARISQ